MKKYLFLLLLLCANIVHGQTNFTTPDSLAHYKIDEVYRGIRSKTFELDLNNDGLKDEALISGKGGERILYFFLQDQAGEYHCALRSWNLLSDDMPYFLDLSNDGEYITILTAGPFKSLNYTYYYLEYNDGRWIIDHSEYKLFMWEVDHTRYYSCIIPQNVDLALVTGPEGNYPLNKEPDDIYASKQCEPKFWVDDLYGFGDRFLEYDYDDKRTVRMVERYEDLLAKYPISSQNIDEYLFIAFSALQDSIYPEAVYLLEQINQKITDRTEAFLYLADAYWAVGEKAEAKKAYKKYLSLMKKQKQDPLLVPERVHKRV